MRRASPTQTIHALYGRPAVTHPEPTGPIDAPHGCRVCGGPCDRGMAYGDWGGSDTTTPGRVRAWMSGVTCEACVAICARFSPCPARPPAEGKEPIRWSNLSLLYDDRGLVTATKGEKARIREWLAQPREGEWFAAIAESGQKHVIPWARWNPAGARCGVVRFEERDVTCGPELLELTADMTLFLTLGATKETIESGSYSQNQWRSIAPQIELFEARWGSRERGGDLFALALWLAQRDEAETAIRIERETAERAAKKSAEKEKAKSVRSKPSVAKVERREEPRRDEGAASGVAPVAPQRVPRKRSKRDLPLGAPADAAAGSGADVGDVGRVDHNDAPQAPARSAQQGQLSLFDRAGD